MHLVFRLLVIGVGLLFPAGAALDSIIGLESGSSRLFGGFFSTYPTPIRVATVAFSGLFVLEVLLVAWVGRRTGTGVLFGKAGRVNLIVDAILLGIFWLYRAVWIIPYFFMYIPEPARELVQE
jgi:hypothetical protein